MARSCAEIPEPWHRFALIEVVRAPMLGYLPSGMTWLMAVVYSLLLLAVTWSLMVRARGRVPFWL